MPLKEYLYSQAYSLVSQYPNDIIFRPAIRFFPGIFQTGKQIFEDRLQQAFIQSCDLPDLQTDWNTVREFVHQVNGSVYPQSLQQANKTAYLYALGRMGPSNLKRFAQSLPQQNDEQIISHMQDWVSLFARSYKAQGLNTSEVAQILDIKDCYKLGISPKDDPAGAIYFYRYSIGPQQHFPMVCFEPSTIEACRRYAAKGKFAYAWFLGTLLHETVHGLNMGLALYPGRCSSFFGTAAREYSRVHIHQAMGMGIIKKRVAQMEGHAKLKKIINDIASFRIIDEQGAYQADAFAVQETSKVLGVKGILMGKQRRLVHFACFLRPHMRQAFHRQRQRQAQQAPSQAVTG